jgi:hypothetical protein
MMIDTDDNNNPSSLEIEKSPSLILNSRSPAEYEQEQQPPDVASFQLRGRVSPLQGVSDDNDQPHGLNDMEDFIFEDDILDDVELLVDLYLLFENSRWILKSFLW